jgi:hypothetical protein
MTKPGEISANAQILGSDGVRIGIVAQVTGDQVMLASDNDQNGLDSPAPRFIPVNLIDHVENGIVWLRTRAAEVGSFGSDSTTYSAHSGR